VNHHPLSGAAVALIGSLGLLGCAQTPPAQAVEAAAVEGACTLVVDVTGMQ
jgi:hypothetical protein